MATTLLQTIGDIEALAGRALSEARNAAAYAEESAARVRSIMRTLDDLREQANTTEAENFRLQQENSRLLYDLNEANERATQPLRIVG